MSNKGTVLKDKQNRPDHTMQLKSLCVGWVGMSWSPERSLLTSDQISQKSNRNKKGGVWV